MSRFGLGIKVWHDRRAVSPVVATVILVAIAITLAIAFAFWASGLLGAIGYGTRPVKLAIYSDLELYGGYFVILVKNLGSDIVFIDKIFIDGKPVSYIFDAQTYPPPGDVRWMYEAGSGIIVYINPGETVQIKGVIKNITLAPGVTHEVTLHTTLGFEFHRALHARVVSPMAFPSGGIVAYNTGLKDPNDPSKRLIFVYLKVRNQWQDDLEIYKVEFYNPDTREKVGEEELANPLVIAPGEEWEPKNLSDLIRVSINPGEYIVNVTWRCGKRGGGLASFVNVGSEVIKAYVIYITIDDEDLSNVINEKYPAWHRDPQPFVDILQQYFDVIIISNMSQLKDFIENPPDGHYIVINAHSEPLPIPKAYLDANGGLSGFRDSVKEWHEKIKDLVSGGRVWTQPTGYPFWGTANKRYARIYGCSGWTSGWGQTINSWSGLDSCTGGATEKTSGGSVTYDGVRWATGLPYGNTGTWNCKPTSTNLVDDLNNVFTGANLPTGTATDWDGWDTFDVSSVPDDQKMVFYEYGGKPIIYALKVGGGWYVFISVDRPPDTSSDLSAKMASYISVYVYLTYFVVKK